jgi:hypothetical protein
MWLVETKLPTCHEAALMIKFISLICQSSELKSRIQQAVESVDKYLMQSM